MNRLAGSLRQTLGIVALGTTASLASVAFTDGLPATYGQSIRLTDTRTQVEAEPFDLLGEPGVAPHVGAPPASSLTPYPDYGVPGGVLGADAGFSCPDRWYVVAEAFWLSREESDSFTLSNFMAVEDFDFEISGRVTIGRTYDCLDGWEFTYTGPFRWEAAGAAAFPNGLFAEFQPGPGLTTADLSTFYGADIQTQFHTSELHMAEAYRRWWGWDVFSVKLGGKYLNLDEGFELRSLNDGELGQLIVEGDNHIGLAALGIDMMSPMGRWTFGAKLTGSIGINFNDGNFIVVNDGTPIVARGDSSEEFAWMVDGGFYTIYRLTNRLSLHAGYEAWYLWGVNVPSEQDYSFITLDSGKSFDEKGHIFFHGATAGIEFVW